MKLFFNLLGIAVAGTLGYLVEPSVRFQLTGIQPSAVEIARNTNVLLQMPDGGAPIDVASLTPEQLPQRVRLNTAVKVSDPATGSTTTIPAGSHVKLVRIERGNAVVGADGGSSTGPVPITETDLVDQIAANHFSSSDPPVAPPEVAPVVPAAPVTPAVGDSEEPAKLPEPPPVSVAPPAPTPEPVPAPEPPPAVATAAPDSVKVMQDSIKAAQIKEFTFGQVLEWKAGANETVDGETYQTGLASYKAETIFGVKMIQAKALIKAGKVHRWIWPKSGTEIK
jgi:hypothetical protein